MSYETEAEKNIREAKELVGDAIKRIGQITVEECLGTNDLKQGRVEELEQVLNDLLAIRRRI